MQMPPPYTGSDVSPTAIIKLPPSTKRIIGPPLFPLPFSHFDFNLRKGVERDPEAAPPELGATAIISVETAQLPCPWHASQKGKFTFETSAAAFPAPVVTINF